MMALDYVRPHVLGVQQIILEALADEPFVVREALIERIWTSFNEPVDPDNTLNVHISQLRRKLRLPHGIRAIAGGFMLEPSDLPWPVTMGITKSQRIVLEALMDGRGHTVGHFGGLLGRNHFGYAQTVRQFISSIRRKLQPGWSIDIVGVSTYRLTQNPI